MKPTIAVALSGGVDSLVSAYLLQQEGYRVIGLHFLSGFEIESHGRHGKDDELNCAKERLAPISKLLQIPIEVVDLSSEFQKNVIDYFVNTYQSGQTPNPCLVCNPSIKFDLLARYAREMGAVALATGHYARRKKRADDTWQLCKGADPHKDQSYFLSRLTQNQLAFARFPLGTMLKKNTVALAHENGLQPITQKESQDICFIRDGNYVDFLKSRIGFSTVPGPIEDVDGKVIGTHSGLHRFTIGQRRGINCPAAEPYYVVRLIPKRNCLVVGFKHTLNNDGCKVVRINWINSIPTGPFRASARLRYRHKEVPAGITPQNDNEATILFDSPQKAVTPGQGAVLYQDDIVLGGGWISAVQP